MTLLREWKAKPEKIFIDKSHNQKKGFLSRIFNSQSSTVKKKTVKNEENTPTNTSLN